MIMLKLRTLAQKTSRIASGHARRLFGAHPQAIAGVASVELAIIAPLLTVAIICTTDLGFGIYRRMQVQAAAQAGAEYAITRGFTESGITTAVTASTSFSGVAATPAPYKFCGCPTTSGVTTISCNATCADTSKPGTYVTVSAQGNYDTILPYPMFPATFVFSAQSTARVQ